MAQYDITPERTFNTPYAADERVTVFLRSVYAWMCAGLGITAVVAYFVAQSPGLVRAIGGNPIAYWGLMILQLGIVFFLSARVDKIASGTASLLFLLYSALTGVTFAFILLVYTGESVATHVHGLRGDVRRIGAVRHDDEPQPRRLGPVPVHGPDRRRPRVDRRHLLAERRAAVRHRHSSA